MTDSNAKYLTPDDANNPELQNLEQVNRAPIKTSAGQPPDVEDRYQGGIISGLGLQPDITNSQLPGSSPVYRLMPASNAGNPQTNAAIQSTTTTTVASLPPSVTNLTKVTLNVPSTLFTPATQTGNVLSIALIPQLAGTFFAAPAIGSSDVISGSEAGGGKSTDPYVFSITPPQVAQFAMLFVSSQGGGPNTPNPGAGWTQLGGTGIFTTIYTQFLTTTDPISINQPSAGFPFAGILALFGTAGVSPTLAQPFVSGLGTTPNTGVSTPNFGSPNTAGNTIVAFVSFDNESTGPSTGTVTDTLGNTYVFVNSAGSLPDTPNPNNQALLFVATNIVAGSPNAVKYTGTGGGGVTVTAMEYNGIAKIDGIPTFRHIVASDIAAALGAASVTSVQGETGAITLTSSGATITITTPSASVINLEAAGGTVFYQTVQQAGSSKTQRPKLNFLAPIQAADNAGNTSTDISVPVFGASGGSHATGLVPDPGSVLGTARYLREDATWVSPSGGPNLPAVDGLIHGDGVWETDSAYVEMRDDFNGGVFATGTASIGELGWFVNGSVPSGVMCRSMPGGLPGVGAVALTNTGTTNNFSAVMLTASTGTRDLYMPLFDYPVGWKATFVFAWVPDSNFTATASPLGKKSFYIGLACTQTPAGGTGFSGRPLIFYGLRFDTDPGPATGNITLASCNNASSGTTVYNSASITSSATAAGQTYTVSGFTTSANNGSFLCTAASSTTLTLANPNGVAETKAATATAPTCADSTFKFEAVNNILNSTTTLLRNDFAGTVVNTGVTPTPGNVYRLEIEMVAAGTITMSLNGSTPQAFTLSTITAGPANNTSTSASIQGGFATLSLANLAQWNSGAPFVAGSKITVAGITQSGFTTLNGAKTVTTSTSTATLLFPSAAATQGNAGISGSITVVGYPAVMPYCSYGNDTSSALGSNVLAVYFDYFSLIWNPGVYGGVGVPDSTKARYW